MIRRNRSILREAFIRGYKAAKKQLNERWDTKNSLEDVAAVLNNYFYKKLKNYDSEYLQNEWPEDLKNDFSFHELFTEAAGWVDGFIDKQKIDLAEEPDAFEKKIWPVLEKALIPVIEKNVNKWGLKGKEAKDTKDYIQFVLLDELNEKVWKDHQVRVQNEIRNKRKKGGLSR